MSKKLVIFGLTDVAQLAHYYFTHDSDYEVAAFVVDKEYLDRTEFCGLPVVASEDAINLYPPAQCEMFLALGYSKINQFRRDQYFLWKEKGYQLASYISSRASIFAESIGDNCFILEDNTLQPFVRIGNNVTLWSGNHIGHHAVIGDHCFLASHIVVSGRVNIGERCFLGVNATLRNSITIGEQCVIGAGTLLLEDAAAKGVYIGTATERSAVPSDRLRKI